ncbi:hypothetical protein CEV32_3030 [Brucella rhizosphaerae]|uniref:Uncharacterized protein n=1 Tax=Brucella rhizosphaerae TaxID=571254 RepID=A0A256FW03_9HYPH|nr:hypothetical protein CEV32_3030 [Brucella rhizosphaerae]
MAGLNKAPTNILKQFSTLSCTSRSTVTALVGANTAYIVLGSP